MRLNIHTVYIHFIDGSEAYMPLKALLDPGGFSQILPTPDYGPQDRTELWSFRPGDKVLVKRQEIGQMKTLADFAYAPVDSASQIRDENWFLYALCNDQIELTKENQAAYKAYFEIIRAEIAQNNFQYPKIREKILNLKAE